MSSSGILKSSLAKKYAMALTGLFLCSFLVGHLLGNLQLFVPGVEGQTAFNEYALFMTTFPLVKILSYLTYASVLFHVVDGFVLVLQNRKARPARYAMEKGSANSGWSSRNMAVLGTIVLVFIVTHMQNFWWRMHFGDMPTQLVNGQELKDLHTVVMNFLRSCREQHGHWPPPHCTCWAWPASASTCGTASAAPSNPWAFVTKATPPSLKWWARPSPWWCLLRLLRFHCTSS